MLKCAFCGDDIERGTGKVKILKEGKVVPLCSMKCEKNMFKLKRIPRKIKWTAAFRAAKEMRMATAAKTEEKITKKSKK